MTKKNTGIPLSFSHNLAPIRLIELPPALLSLLSNTSSPPTLQIKASSAPTDTHSTSNHAVLTTPTQTFSLRQVYSSNSLLLLKPSTTTSLNIVSTANSYMELVPTIHDATNLILQHIPVFPPPADLTPATRADLLASLPVSDGEFDAAWRDLHCFTCPKGFAYRPLPSAILETLKAIQLVNAAEEDDGVELGKFTPEDLVEAIDRYYTSLHEEDDDDDEEPQRCIPGLVEAVALKVSSANHHEFGPWLAVNQSTWAQWVGKLVLEDWASKGKGDMLYVSFLKKWKQETPFWCSEECELKTIEGWYTHPTPNTIRFAPGGNAVAAEDPKPQKKKWHEKLGKGKRR